MSLAKFLLDFLQKENFFTEVLAIPGAPPKVRKTDELVAISDKPVTPEETKAALIYLREVAGKVGAIDKKGIFTFAYKDVGRIRVIYGMQRNTYYLSLLKVPFNTPEPEKFFLNPYKFPKFAEAVYHERGKIYAVCGEDWFINATFIGITFDYILQKGGKVVFTIENPLSYLLKHKNGLVIQKELYEDIFQLKDGLEDIPLVVPDFVYIFDALNIYNLNFEEIFQYIPHSVNIFFNFPMKGKVFVKHYVEKVGLKGVILIETKMDYNFGLVDFNISSAG